MCEYAGITYRQLDYWTSNGWLHTIDAETPGSGHRRRFPALEIFVAALFKQVSLISIRMANGDMPAIPSALVRNAIHDNLTDIVVPINDFAAIHIDIEAVTQDVYNRLKELQDA